MLAGFLLAPFSAAGIGVVTYDSMWHLGFLSAGGPIHSLDAAESLGLGLAILAIVMTVVGAVPGVMWLSSRGGVSVRSLVMLGALLGNIPFAVIVVGIAVAALRRGENLGDLGQYWYGLGGAVVRVVLGIVTGVGSALVFWVVAILGTRSTPQRAP